MSQPTPPTPETPDSGDTVPTCYRHQGRETYIRCQRCDQPICPECMRDAAVGFQCVECVKKGAKDTRSGRTAYGGLKPTDASVTSITLIAINIVVWVALQADGGFSGQLFNTLALRPNGFTLPGVDVTAYGVADGAFWQPVTSMFTHVKLWHLAFNCLALWILGPQLEVAIGRARFLALYFISGLAGGALVMWAGPEFSGTHGASGAVFGLMGGLVVVAYKVGGNVTEILAWIGFNFFLSTFYVQNVSWQGHLGGLLGGLACAAVIVYTPRGPKRTTYQVAGLSGIAILAVVAIAARAVMLA